MTKETAEMDFRTSNSSARRRGVVAILAATAALLALCVAGSAAQAVTAPEMFGLANTEATVSTNQAGGHADVETRFMLQADPTSYAYAFGGPVETPWANLRNLATELPPGMVGNPNPNAFKVCSSQTFLEQLRYFSDPTVEMCPFDSQIGMIEPGLSGLLVFPPGVLKEPLYNLEAPGGNTGVVARFGFIGIFYPIFIDVRVDPEREYGVTPILSNANEIVPIEGSYNHFWGDPTSTSHDLERFTWLEAILCLGPCPKPPSYEVQPIHSGLPPTPFMSSPTSCGPSEIDTYATSYQLPESFFDFSRASLGEFENCGAVPFEASASAKPTTTQASSSSGIDASIHVSQEGLENPEAIASSHLKKAVIKLPQGISLDPSAADGLGSCSEEQFGLQLNERQIVDIGAVGAPAILTVDGQSTPELPDYATPAQVQSALEGLPNVGKGGVSVGGRAGGPWSVEFTGPAGNHDFGPVGGTNSEVQRISTRSDSGSFKLIYESSTTSAIPLGASSEEVQQALESLPGIEPGDVEVSSVEQPHFFGTFRDVNYRVVFTGGLAQTDVPEITMNSNALQEPKIAKTFTLVNGLAEVDSKTRKDGGTITFNSADPTCPEASKIATGVISTPLLEEQLVVSLYVAKQNDNPFHSLFAGYMLAKGAGVTIKTAGRFDIDQQTGQITATFENLPQQPFEDLELHFKSGNRGVITTPKTCGTYNSTYELFPWSGNPPVTGTSSFTIDQNCNPGGFQPGFNSGSSSPLAGGFTSFGMQVTRNPGSQQLVGVTVEPPQGITGELAGIPYCPDSALAAISAAEGTGASELASPHCPAASQVGTVIAGAGSGRPFYVKTGKAYLAGPYKGAPISIAIDTPVVAGPFDLGSVMVRTAVYLDRATAQLKAVSDPLPTMRSGIPLEITDLRVNLDRSAFMMNPTDCAEKSVTGTISGDGGASAHVSQRFQVGECASLGFKPKVALKVRGGTKRTKHPQLTFVLRPRPGDANVSSVSVALPSSELLDQSHIGTVCTRVQFAANQCPAASIYGHATAISPLLSQPLTGNVYLRSSNNKLPDLVLDLRGPDTQPIEIEAAGRTDTVHGALRNTFGFVPDAPLTRVVVSLLGGKKGLLQNTIDICAHRRKASVHFEAHNGRVYTVRPALQVKCGGHRGKHHKRHGAR